MLIVAACSLFLLGTTIVKYEDLFVILSIVSLGIGTCIIIFALIYRDQNLDVSIGRHPQVYVDIPTVVDLAHKI